MFLTAPQSRHFLPLRFEDLSPRENHFDWDLFYRFKDERERFWLDRMETDSSFRSLVERHFTEFHGSIEDTIRFLDAVPEPLVLDVGLSSEPLDRALMTRMKARLVVLDLQEAAATAYESVFAGRGSFVLGDVVSYAAEPANAESYDLVYSVGLIEHFPDKRDILGAHVTLTKPGGVVLIYVPLDSDDNRRLTSMAAEYENFGYRELLTVNELESICADECLEVLASEPVGFFAAFWGRKKLR
jgi:2-polyprenyl-3-methyl-5-hydroxy-6-metoxy-1,4-benzoquinol methylase